MNEKYLVITIDTEEDIWDDYFQISPPIKNIENISKLQKIFDRYNVVPTYLINYSIVSDMIAIEKFKEIFNDGRCDIGTHCHPWNTPPIEETICENNTYLCNLDSDELVYKKLRTIHRLIEDNLEVTPVVFRAGRWGIGNNVLRAIARLNYRIDTSMIPFWGWKDFGGPVCVTKSLKPHKIEVEYDCVEKNETRCQLIEVPPSTGYLQKDFHTANKIDEISQKTFLRKLHLPGILEKFRLVNYRWLSPELSNTSEMILLAKRILDNKIPILNMTLHSTSLLPGSSPFVRNERDLDRLLNRIDAFLSYISALNIKSIGMSQIEGYL